MGRGGIKSGKLKRFNVIPNSQSAYAVDRMINILSSSFILLQLYVFGPLFFYMKPLKML